MAISYLNNIDLHLNEIRNARLQNVGTDPTGVAGQIIYHSGNISSKTNGNPKYYAEDGKWHIFADQTYAHDQAISAVDTIFDFSDGKRTTIQSRYLPSYVDDVIEVDNYAALPKQGESSKIYVTKDTNKTYRWSGTGYVEISASLALGYTSSTAFRGDEGLAMQKFYEPASEAEAKVSPYKFKEVTIEIDGVTSAVNKISRYAQKDFEGNIISSTYLNKNSTTSQTVKGPVSFSSKVSFATGSGKGISIGSKTIEEISNLLTITGNTKVIGTFETTGNAKLASLSVTGISTLNGATTINNTLGVTGKATFSGTNGILIGTSTDGVTLTYSSSKLQINKGINTDEGITAKGDINGSSITTTGAISGGSLTISETTNLNGSATIGNSQDNKLTVNATPTFKTVSYFDPAGIKFGDSSSKGSITYDTSSTTLTIGKNVHIPGTLAVDGLATFNGTNGIQIGNSDKGGRITWDGSTNALKIEGDIYVTGNITAGGKTSTDAGTGGGMIEAVYSYNQLKNGTYPKSDVTDDNISNAFNAYTTLQLYNKIKAIESTGATDIVVDGVGPVITGVSKNGNTISFTTGTEIKSDNFKLLNVHYGEIANSEKIIYNPIKNEHLGNYNIYIPTDLSHLTNIGTLKFTRIYSSTITPGTGKTIQINHGLNTKNVHVILYYKSSTSSEDEQVFADTKIVDVNNIKLAFATIPSGGTYTVVVIG